MLETKIRTHVKIMDDMIVLLFLDRLIQRPVASLQSDVGVIWSRKYKQTVCLVHYDLVRNSGGDNPSL
jgi:hypothetical protein